MDIIKAAKERRIADVQLVLQHAPERVNDQNSVLLLLHTHTLLIVAVGQFGRTALHWAAIKNSLEVAEVLVAANANADIKDNVRAGCS
jgi:ankyrin repeat protein